MSKQPARFASRSAVLRNDKLSFPARLLYTLMDDIAGERGVLWPKQSTIADMLGVTSRAVRNWIEELAAAELVWQDRQKRSVRYVLAWNQDRNGRSHLKIEIGTPASRDRNGRSALIPITELREELKAPLHFPEDGDETAAPACFRCRDTGREVLGKQEVCRCQAGQALRRSA